MSPSQTSEASLPVFFERPSPLNKKRHAGYALDRTGSFDFASTTNAVPINSVEFAIAARYYPIVFSTDEAPAAMAVLGLEEGRNLFVDEAGAWAAGYYIPAYVRRYPFIFMEHDGGTQWTLCVDEAAAAVRADGEGEALFADGEPSEVTNQALEFCTAFQREAATTRELAAALAEAELLQARTVNINHGNGSTRAIQGFQAIDEVKFNALADEVVLDWRKRGFLAAIYAQLFSAGAWAGLAARE